jgi:hypothetical protein
MEYGDKVAEETRRKVAERAQKNTETAAYLSTVALIVDPARFETTLIPALNDQLELHRRLSIKTTIPKSHFKSKRQRYVVLQVLVDRHNARNREEAVNAGVDFLAESV